MNVKKLKKNKKGFTLVEIIVVLVIIGILMALAVPAVMKYINEAADTKVQSQVRAGYVAAQSYACLLYTSIRTEMSCFCWIRSRMTRMKSSI